MSGGFRNRINSLGNRLMISLMILVVFMGLISFYLYRNTYVRALEEAYDDFDVFSDDMGIRLEFSLDALEKAARQAGYNLSVQDYLFSESPELVISSQRSAASFLAVSFHPAVDCINLFLTGGGERYMRLNNSYINEYRTMLRQEGLENKVQLAKPRFIKANLGRAEETCYFYLYPIYGYSYSTQSNQILCTILFDARELIFPLQSRLTGKNILAVLFQNSVIYTSSPLTEEQRNCIVSLDQGAGQRVTVEGIPCLASCSTGRQADWKFVCLLPEDEIKAEARASLRGSILYIGAALFCILAILILVYFPTKRDLNRLTRGIRELELPRSRRDAFTGGAELTELKAVDQALSQTLARLDDSVTAYEESQRKAYEARLAKINAELLGYRSQINPHFLFNSMESLRSLATIEHAEKTAKMVSSMAGIFRYALQATMNVKLEEEVRNTEDYLQVMNTRFPDRYELHKEIPEEALKTEISSMVLQPLVENCVTHAFPPRQSPCVILLAAELTETDLRIRVRDNGRGMEPDRLRMLEEEIHKEEIIAQDARSIGLKNVCHRMELSYGEKFQMNFRSEPGVYMEVELVLPRLERRAEEI